MSYLSELTIKFYNKLFEYYQQNEEHLYLGEPSNYEREIKSCFYKITNGQENFFKIFYHFFNHEFFDADFIADCIDDSVYFANPLVNRRRGKEECFQDYYAVLNKKLWERIEKTIYVRRIMCNFINKMRMYYLNDFMKEHSRQGNIYDFKRLYNRLVYLTCIRININGKIESNEVVQKLEETRLELLDKCSLIIDSSDFRELVISQQEYYISELERLEKAIEEKGNVTKYNNKVFGMYKDFIRDFKKNAISKKEKLISERERDKIKTFIFK